MSTGFIGIGVMGQPMALNLLRAGRPLWVWNRSTERCAPLAQEGARIAASVDELFAQTSTIILMLIDSKAMDEVLGRGTKAFEARVHQKTLVSMGTFNPSYSRALGDDVRAAGGVYIEAPVSGSRKPAEAGQLVAMVAGDAEHLPGLAEVLAPMCSLVVPCGEVPAALTMKLAVNVFLIATVTGLAESAHFAAANGLNLQVLQTILDAGPMASAVSRMKLDKLVREDFSVQAAIPDVLKNSQLVTAVARERGIASPILDLCESLYGETLALGFSDADMAAVVRSLEARTQLNRRNG